MSMAIRKSMKTLLRGMKQWLDEGDERPAVPEMPTIPFDNTYPWLHASFRKLMQDPVCGKRPPYIWGVLQGAALGKVLGMQRVSVMEFGVAGGAGLLAMERAAELCEEMVNIGIDVYGFDTGVGQPKPLDYRDRPYFWLEGFYPCDQEQLAKRLRRARLKLGLIDETIPAFLKTAPSPIAFIAFDMCFYSSTADALKLFEAGHERLLPRIPGFFRTTLGRTCNDFTGERLAISEFNSLHTSRKISPMYGLRYFVPPGQMNLSWPEMFYSLHIFDHPLYNAPQQLRLPSIIDVEGNESYHSAGQWKDLGR